MDRARTLLLAAAVALQGAAGCGDDTAGRPPDGAPGPDAHPDAPGPDAHADAAPDGAPDGGCALAFDNVPLSLPGQAAAEVSGAVAPDGTLVAAFCHLGSGSIATVRGNGRTLAFDPPADLPPGFCDPTLTYSPGTGGAGTFFLANDCVGATGGYGICLHRSSDGGRTWTGAASVDEFDPGAGLVDRPWVFAAPGGGAVVTWNRYPGPLSANIGYTLTADIGADGLLGATSMLTDRTPTSTSVPGMTDPAGNAFAVGTLATDLQPASEHGPMALWSRVTGGAWQKTDVPSPGGPIYIYPALAVTPRGTVLVLYTDEASAIFLLRSTDGGATFAPPLRVNPASTTPHTLLLWAQASADGVARFTWYEADRPPPARWNVYYARSEDDGLTVSAPLLVNDGGVFPGTNGEYDENYTRSNEPWLGDFIGVLSDGARDYVLYTDNRDAAGPAVYLAASRCQ